MSKRARQLWVAGGLAALLGCMAPVTFAQEAPVTLRGVITSGLVSVQTEGANEFNSTTVPLGLTFDLSGYWGHPDFLSFRVQPQFTAGEQAPQAGFQGGDGINLSATFLRRRAFPLTVRFAKFRRESISLGSQQGISGVRSVSHYNNFGVNWQVNIPNAPRISFDFNEFDSRSNPDFVGFPDRKSSNILRRMLVRDSRWGWDFGGSLSSTTRTADLLNPVDPTASPVASERRTKEFKVHATRALWGSNYLALDAGRQSGEDAFNGDLFDQKITFLRANSSLIWGSRWSGSLAASYNSNRNDLLRDLIPPVGGPILFGSGISTLNFTGQAGYRLRKHWNLSGNLSRNRTSAGNGGNTRISSTSLGAGAGVGFNRNFSWGQFSSNYGLSVNRAPGRGGIPGDRAIGQSFSAQARQGKLDGLEVTGNFLFSRNTVENAIFLERENLLTEFSLGRRAGNYLVRGGLGLRRTSSFNILDLDFTSDGWTARASLEHRLYQVQYNRNIQDGRSIILFSSQTAGGAGGSVLPGIPLRTALSSSGSQGLSASLTPRRRLRTTVRWHQLRQTLEGRVRNNTNIFDVRVLYRFRLLDMEAVFSQYDQDVFPVASAGRRHIYFRISRPFRIL